MRIRGRQSALRNVLPTVRYDQLVHGARFIEGDAAIGR